MINMNKRTIFLMLFASSINRLITCSKPETVFEKLAVTNSRLKKALEQPQINIRNQQHKDAFTYAYLLREASELLLRYAQLTEEQNKTDTTRFPEINVLIQKILLNFKEQKALLKRHPHPQNEAVQKKLKDVEILAAKYESCAHLFTFISNHPQQKLNATTQKPFCVQEKKTQAILAVKPFITGKPIYAAQEKAKRLKKEAKKRRLARKKMEAHAQALITRAQLFPILAIRCGLSTKTKDSYGFYLLQKKINDSPHSSYNTLHIIADYLNIKKASSINK